MLAAKTQILRSTAPCGVVSTRRPRTVRVAAQTAEATTEVKPEAAAPAPTSGKAEIYIGHKKDDYEGKRTGTKGRFVVDDPIKYPGRDDLSLCGGWAGGEKGLKAFVSEYQREQELNGQPAAAPKAAKAARDPQPIAKGDDVIYVGKGRIIKDDARKYPGRNELTGGFAGGELGLQAFKATGDVPIAPAGRGTKQTSPLITAFVLGLAATGGGLVLSTIEEVGSSAVEGSGPALSVAAASGLDDKTKLLLTASIVLVGAVGTLAGAQALIETMTTKVKEGASKLAVLGAFWIAVFLAAKIVLDSA